MPGCGESYAHLIRSNTGRSPQAPCEGVFGAEIYCNDPDYSDWYAGMTNLRQKVHVKLRDLQLKAGAAGRQDVADALLIHVHPADAAYAAIKTPEQLGISFPGSGEVTSGIQHMIGAEEFYACALEQIDLAYAKIGQGVPPTPGVLTPSPKHGSAQDWVGLARKGVVLAAVVGSLYVTGRYILPHVFSSDT